LPDDSDEYVRYSANVKITKSVMIREILFMIKKIWLF